VNRFSLLIVALLLSPLARAQDLEKVRPTGAVRNSLIVMPLGVVRAFRESVRDFATFRDPQWSVLTIAQIGAASADGVTSLNNLHSCPSCEETGLSRLFVGRHPDAHKYIIAGIIEISIEAVTGHYFRTHEPPDKWYVRALWTLPQSLSLYGHARASYGNAAIKW
jgi:hypothetical protein